VTAGGAAAVLLLLGAGGALVLHRRFRGAPVERALRVHPALFPEVVRAAAEIRHDVLKHRASALGLVAAGGPREEVARALCEPTPASAAVAEAYDRLRAGAAALGVTLRRLDREPVFGPLVRDLARAEALVSVPSGARYGDRELAELTALDDALRERHPASLARLTTAGPRTRLDPAEVSSWIRAVEAEHRARGSDGADWTAPELHLQEIDIELPVTEPVLATVLANLLRNAAAAVRGQSRPRIVVRVGEERDATGRRLATLLVADSAERTVTAEEIAGRAADRGLGIVRELVRRWGGHLVVRTQEPPLSKAIGAVFPVVTPQAPEVAP
jgi:signal transduction histidine kinase